MGATGIRQFNNSIFFLINLKNYFDQVILPISITTLPVFNPYADGANFANIKWCKNLKNDWNPGKWVLIWEYSVRAIQWIPIWQGLDGFQKSLHPCVLD